MRMKNGKARDPRCQRHRIQISDNYAKTVLSGVTVTGVVLTRTRAGKGLRAVV
jgi:hypothetical protein